MLRSRCPLSSVPPRTALLQKESLDVTSIECNREHFTNRSCNARFAGNRRLPMRPMSPLGDIDTDTAHLIRPVTPHEFDAMTEKPPTPPVNVNKPRGDGLSEIQRSPAPASLAAVERRLATTNMMSRRLIVTAMSLTRHRARRL